MPDTYRVTILRTESIEFTLDANSPEDAEARYLMDGTEVASGTESTTVESVTLDTTPAPNTDQCEECGWEQRHCICTP